MKASQPQTTSEPARKPILFLHATAGTGHTRAAEALVAACAALDVPAQAVDTLDCMKKAFRRIYPKLYIKLVQKTPTLWGYLYDKLDTKRLDSKCQKLNLLLNKLNTKNFLRTICDIDPAVIVCTHFLPLELLSDLKRRGKIDLPIISVVTDVSPHRFWVHPHIDRYYVASANSERELLQKEGVDAQTQVTGIPIDPVFATSRSVRQARTAMGLPEKSTVLIMSGGFGVGPIAEMLCSFASTQVDCSLLVVAGKNDKLKAQCEKIAATLSVDITVYGYVDFVHDLLDAADLVVTKPGGLTMSEILAKGKPMMIVASIPGQEQRNCEYLLEHGAATRLYDFSDAAYYIGQLLNDKARLHKMSYAASQIARPHAALDIVRNVESRYLLHESPDRMH
ncbi:MAG: galactosyldiacylglycerol synthase [Betaproteobacteria bacterium]|jgi:processive 1,2-diacylglycerol beta-glucosyltransferase|nr:galactosyldiacylglycerol synthase [Betaproteobacteria bacterium]